MATSDTGPGTVPAYGRAGHLETEGPTARRRATAPSPGSALVALAGLATLVALAGRAFLISTLLVCAGLATVSLGALWRPTRGRRLRAALLAATSLTTLSACGVVLLGESHLHVPGQRRAHALTARLPFPWRQQVPAHVPLPEGVSSGSGALSLALTPSNAGPGADATEIGANRVDPGASPIAGAAAPANAPAMSIPPPASAKLAGFRHQWQTWNNCGPATITMAMSHFGRAETQAQAAAVLKPNANDRNVNPHELVAYVRSKGLEATWRIGGDLARLKLLLASGVPVLVEVWYAPDPDDWMGHYRLLVGYDDAAGRFLAYDAYIAPGVDVALPYERFDAQWRVFDRVYLPVYRAEQADAVARLLGPETDDRLMYERALAVAQADAATQPNDAFAWFNVGTNLVGLGRTGEAATAFDRARALQLPWRMLWYQFGPFEAYLKEGRLNDVLTLANANLKQTQDLEESHYYRGRALQAQGQVGAARAAYQAALRANPSYQPAYYGLSTLG